MKQIKQILLVLPIIALVLGAVYYYKNQKSLQQNMLDCISMIPSLSNNPSEIAKAKIGARLNNMFNNSSNDDNVCLSVINSNKLASVDSCVKGSIKGKVRNNCYFISLVYEQAGDMQKSKDYLRKYCLDTYGEGYSKEKTECLSGGNFLTKPINIDFFKIQIKKGNF